MNRRMYALGLAVALLVTSTGFAVASPPSSCGYKFVGTWIVRVNSTGQTYPVTNLPSGVLPDRALAARRGARGTHSKPCCCGRDL
jgi:hypothetical protein